MVRFLWTIAIVIAGCLVLNSRAKAQELHFANYSIENGLQYSKVEILFQDSRGYLWIGTNGGGCARFDGKSFVYHNSTNGLSSNSVTAITENVEGSILVGTNIGICAISNGGITRITKDSGEELGYVNCLERDMGGNVWVGTEQGVCQIMGLRVMESPFGEHPLNSLDVISILQSSDSVFWFGTTDNGLYAGQRQPKIHSLSTHASTFHTIAESFDGKILAGTSEGLFSFSQPEGVTLFESTRNQLVIEVLETSPGNIWAGTYQSGIYQLSEQEFRSLSVADGLLHPKVNSMVKDIEGNIWIATDAGIQSHSFAQFENYYVPNQSESVGADKLCITHDNKIVVGTWGQGLYVLFEDTVLHRTAPKAIAHNNVLGLHQDASGSIWASTNYGLSKLNARTFDPVTVPSSLRNVERAFLDVTEHPDGSMWIGSYSMGVFHLEGGVVVNYRTEEGLPSNTIWDIEVDASNAIWFATGAGIAKRNAQDFVVWTTEDDLPAETVLLAKSAPDGSMWFGLEDGGIVKLIEEGATTRFEHFNASDGLHDNGVVAMEFDGKGSLWIGTSRGVDRLDVDLYERTGQKAFRHYDKADGFLGVECNQNAIVRDHDGDMWFGTVKGAVKYKPEFDVPNTIEPRTHITGVNLFFNEVDWTAQEWRASHAGLSQSFALPTDLHLAHNQNHLTFEFTGISLTVPERVRYKYKLVGFDEEWTPETENREATYSNLPPGDYTFMVKAANNDGLWNSEPTTFSFTIKTPFWQTWWFYSLLVLFVIASVIAFVTLRTRALIRAKNRLQTMVREATAEIVSQRDEIARKNKDITDSIEYAKTLQEAVLPTSDTISSLLPNHFVFYQPRDIVSGDFYWFHERDEQVFVVAADCTGHGVPGAFVSMMGSNLLNQIVIENRENDPGRILSELNRQVKMAFKRNGSDKTANDGMDIAFCVIDRKSQLLKFAGAMNGMVYIRDGEAKEIGADRTPIGGRTPDDFNFATQVIQYQPGDSVYMYSDGYPDQFGGPRGKKFMAKRFRQMLGEICELKAEEQRLTLKKVLEDWMGEHGQVDDVMVIGFEL